MHMPDIKDIVLTCQSFFCSLCSLVIGADNDAVYVELWPLLQFHFTASAASAGAWHHIMKIMKSQSSRYQSSNSKTFLSARRTLLRASPSFCLTAHLEI